ncbi:hypothetical protein DL766_007981 [Monosporascus sp. MC13-8B]|nr:hypothetical protein DL763_006870 [Monosporascus cannonballus]RYP21296.1 hypothetical protein DL766_007981 [Monosporascus sp. MC13-8B]
MFLKAFSVFTLMEAAAYAVTLPALAGSANLARDVAADPISKYTTQWFADNVCNPPDTPGDCLFDTKGLSRKAQELTANPDNFLKSIWEMWESYLYNDKWKDTNNPLREIIADEKLRYEYFSNMSGAMAFMCEYVALFMVRDEDFPEVRPDGIWGQVEFEQLKRADGERRVDIVTVINTDGAREADLWARPGERKRFANASVIPTAAIHRHSQTEIRLNRFETSIGFDVSD